MTKITVDKALIEQAIEAAFSPYCAQALGILVPALRAALAKPAVEPSHKLIYPGGGKSLFDKLWHLTCNAVATQSGMRVRTDVLPMIEMREFLHYLCALVDSPPSAPPAELKQLQEQNTSLDAKLASHEAVIRQALTVIELHPYPGWDNVREAKKALKRALNPKE